MSEKSTVAKKQSTKNKFAILPISICAVAFCLNIFITALAVWPINSIAFLITAVLLALVALASAVVSVLLVLRRKEPVNLRQKIVTISLASISFVMVLTSLTIYSHKVLSSQISDNKYENILIEAYKSCDYKYMPSIRISKDGRFLTASRRSLDDENRSSEHRISYKSGNVGNNSDCLYSELETPDKIRVDAEEAVKTDTNYHGRYKIGLSKYEIIVQVKHAKDLGRTDLVFSLR